MHLTGNLRRGQRGVGLIEVLIAVLVLSFGMLGLVGLQTWSLRNNQSALERGMATVLTHSIADAMRADRVAASSGAFDIEIDDPAPTGTGFPDVALAAWRNGLVQSLNASATGAIDCNGGFTCIITVRWNDQRATGVAAEANMQVVTEVRL